MLRKRLLGWATLFLITACSTSSTLPEKPVSGRPTTSEYRFVKPVATQYQVTSHFGQRGGRPHEGTDFAVKLRTPIMASADGKVTTAAIWRGYGKIIIVNHGNGWTSRYAHLSTIDVEAGQYVKAGEQIGRSGKSGNATGPHLHFEIRQNDIPLNPEDFLN
ncbi:MAG: M23 family metallopeptidase [bacterium]